MKDPTIAACRDEKSRRKNENAPNVDPKKTTTAAKNPETTAVTKATVT